MTLPYRMMLAFIAAVILLCFGLMVYAAAGHGTYLQYLPAVDNPPDYPSTGWTVIAVWGNQAETFATLTHADGWQVTGRCIDPAYPAPPLGASCTLVGATFFCDGYSQRYTLVELLITPTPTETLTPTPLPTDTPEPTLAPPTGITETPTPEVAQ